MLGGIFGGGKRRDAPRREAGTLSPAIASSILGIVGAKAIQPMPAAAQKAFELATDPNAEARDFIEVLQSDEALAARVVKIANSVFYDRGKPSTTIEDSVLVIGINELRGLLNANTLSDIFPCPHPARTQLWANDIATALIAKALAQRLKPAKTADAFLAGLMHDVGKLLLLQRNTGDYQRVLLTVEGEAVSFCEAEERVFPFDHTEVGQLIAERWRFSPELTAVIRTHHRPLADLTNGGLEIELPALIKIADLLAHALGLGHPKGFNRFRLKAEESLSEVWELLRIPPAEQKPLLAQCRRTFEVEYDLYSGTFGR